MLTIRTDIAPAVRFYDANGDIDLDHGDVGGDISSLCLHRPPSWYLLCNCKRLAGVSFELVYRFDNYIGVPVRQGAPSSELLCILVGG